MTYPNLISIKKNLIKIFQYKFEFSFGGEKIDF